MAEQEPSARLARRTGEMTTHPGTPDRRHAHARHDPAQLAAHAAGDLEGIGRDQVEAWLASCTSCAAVHADLVAIAAGVQSMRDSRPSPAVGRDFRLRAADARRLRPIPAWRRALSPLLVRGGPGRSIAATLTALGMVGLLLTSVPMGLPGFGAGSASAPARDTSSQEGKGVPTSLTPAFDAASPGPTSPGAAGPAAASPVANSDTPPPGTSGSRSSDTHAIVALDDPLRTGLVIVSSAVLVAGLGLLLLRRFARAPA